MAIGAGLYWDGSGMTDNAGIRPAELNAMTPAIQKAVRAIEILREEGFAQGQYFVGEFLSLPYSEEGLANSPQLMERLHEIGAAARNEADMVVSIGIGGSYLGAKTITDLYGGPYWNLDADLRAGYPEIHYAGYTADPEVTVALSNYILRRAQQKPDLRIWIIVVSKSGTTAEPLATWLYLHEALARKGISYRLFTVTDKGNEIHIPYAAEAEHFYIPAGVSGRLSVFTAAGLLPAVCIGANPEEFLAGAREVDERTRGAKPEENAPLYAAILKHSAHCRHGIVTEICMPYIQSLAGVADWYAQLLAESLGKKHTRDGAVIHYGRTPVSAVGTRDMHSQTQEHQEGLNNKLLQFITLREYKRDPEVPLHPLSPFPGGTTFGGLSLAAKRANEQALASDGRYSCTISLPDTSLHSLGALMYFFSLAIMYEAELANINAYDQPGVEVYKKILRGERDT